MIWKTRLSRHMICLLAHPLPPSPVSKMYLFLRFPVCSQSSLLTGEWGGGGAKSKKSWLQSLALYKSFNTLRPKARLGENAVIDQSDVIACKPDQVLVDKQLSG
jgi:hypothetical protein